MHLDNIFHLTLPDSMMSKPILMYKVNKCIQQSETEK